MKIQHADWLTSGPEFYEYVPRRLKTTRKLAENMNRQREK